eukprot:6210310-Pleurochrysis_carterae.AAC.2
MNSSSKFYRSNLSDIRQRALNLQWPMHLAPDTLEEQHISAAALPLAPCAAVSAGQRRRTPEQRRAGTCRYGLK